MSWIQVIRSRSQKVLVSSEKKCKDRQREDLRRSGSINAKQKQNKRALSLWENGQEHCSGDLKLLLGSGEMEVVSSGKLGNMHYLFKTGPYAINSSHILEKRSFWP
jgi:hypothetical protein